MIHSAKIGVILLSFITISLIAEPIIVDHSCTNIFQVPVNAIQQAKEQLHIGYGFTSHGSQIVSGMTGLVDFMNDKGYETDLFDFSRDGANGTLHLYEGDGYGDGDLDHDAGYYPNWVEETRVFLGLPNEQGMGTDHSEINVIMWAWCGQLSWYSSEDVDSLYLNEMAQLESDYFGVMFVHMTGHSDGSGLEGTLHNNNQKIRDYCVNNDKVLFDYYDIECYDPDGNYFGNQYVSDDCSYDGGNWAQEWQDSHTQGEDWYDCESAHSEPLNANLKAYAAWWLWARLAGWAGDTSSTAISYEGEKFSPSNFKLEQNYPNPFNPETVISYRLSVISDVRLDVYNAAGQHVSNLVSGQQSAGSYQIQFNGSGLPSGIYVYQLRTEEYFEKKKMLLVK